MKGLRLHSLKRELKTVEKSCNLCPINSIVNDRFIAYILENIENNCYELYCHFFEVFCKILYYNSKQNQRVSTKVRDYAERNAQISVVTKILSSVWRWGFGDIPWNDLVEIHNRFRNFKLSDDPRFEVRLDFPRSYLECGWTKFAKVYVDGSFAFLIYFKSKHILTIGFSITEDRRILIQQVQAPKRTCNRGLFRLPQNRLEFAIDLFIRNFPGYEIYVVSGKKLTEKLMQNYLKAHQHVLSFNNQEEAKDIQTRIKHLKSDKQRINSFYRNTGKHFLGRKSFCANSLSHRIVKSTAFSPMIVGSVA